MGDSVRGALLRTTCVGILGLVASVRAVPAQEASRQIALALEYIAAQEGVMHAEAGAAEVDSLLSFVTDDFTYLHPAVNARIVGKAAVREGIVSHLGETTDPEIRASSAIQEGSVVTLITHTSFRTRDGQAVERSGTMVLVFRDDRIALRADF